MTDPIEIKELAEDALAALQEVFDTIDEVREKVIAAVSAKLHGEAMSAFINETIGELDEISSHYSTDIVWVDEVAVNFLRCGDHPL